MTGQATPVVCPLTGRRLAASIKARVGGAEVGLCCQGCKNRVEQASFSEQLALLFNEETFARCFHVGQAR